MVDPVTGEVSDLNHLTGSMALCEPAGIAAAGDDRLLLSDTNNHRILEVDLRQGIVRAWAA